MTVEHKWNCNSLIPIRYGSDLTLQDVMLTRFPQQLKKEGQQQNAEGKGQEAAGQLNDFGSGVANRATGAVGGAIAGLTGDRDAQIKAQDQHDIGKTQQRGAEHDIQKQNS